jgi:heme/copper-type cytochrome/quinol oxidase subunit 2
MRPSAATPAAQPAGQQTKGSWLLWIFVIIAFLILISAWTVLIIIATRNQPEIPETGGLLEPINGLVALRR